MSKLKCPDCNSMNTKVYRTINEETKIVRYHECRECNRKFKSMQRREDLDELLEKVTLTLKDLETQLSQYSKK